ncbi:MAG: DNA polymerase I [Candidatus Melainabacteria bacterium]|nr:MAG: DNA polymerase I [Candidatus Melainabacteria bacterium]
MANQLQKTLILIDGHALAFRQYFALERTGMKTSDGTPTWAVYGFFKSIFDLLKNNDIKPDAIAVAFDVGRQTFRVEKYHEYKANREAMPDPLRTQLGLIVDGLKAFNIPIYTKEGFEADDVIGTITAKAAKLGHKTLILTGDQDSFQLIDREGLVKVLIPSKGELIEYDWYKVHEKLGVWPSQVIDYKGLRGDTSDNIPGVKGIGEKSAQKLLTRYSRLEDILDDIENIPENAIRNRLKAGIEDAKLSKYLATIVRNVDIDFDFEDTKVELPEISQVVEYLKKMQFYSFVKNIDNILCTFDKNCDELPVKPQVTEQKEDKPLVQFKEDNTPQMQLGLFASVVKETVETETYDSKTISDVNELNNTVQELLKKEEIALTFVSDFENAVTIDLIGCAIAYKDENEKIQSVYVANKDGLIEGLKPVFENENLKKYTYNAKNDINILKSIDIDLKNISFDTVLASYIKNPNRSHDLNAQALDYINHISFELDFPTKKTKFAQLPQTDLITYAQDNAFSIYKLTQFWLKDLSPEELKLHDKVELPLTHILAQMEYDGVALDVDYMSELSEYMTQKAEDLQAKIYEIAGEEFNINSPKQVGEVLYEKLNIQLKKKRGKAKPSTNVEVLEELASEYPICRYLIDYRKYTKLRTTYTDALPLLVSLKDRRIHTTYNQTVTATGRLSSSNPNLQNIPIRTEEGNKLRNAFIAENENDFILSSDYSQIELRLLAHVSGDENLISAFNSDVDVHSLTASKVFDVPVEQVTKEMRYKSKAVNFGIIYGQTRYGLAKALDIPAQEAQNFIDKYFMTYPKVKDYMENTVAFAYEHGFVETIFGRKRYLPELASPNRMIKEFAERAAINQPLQGTAADLIKMAMINVDKVFKENNLKSKMVMQVHDELVFEVVADELEQVKTLVKQEMQNVANLKVPLLVDINWGKSWKEQ